MPFVIFLEYNILKQRLTILRTKKKKNISQKISFSGKKIFVWVKAIFINTSPSA